MKKVINKIGTVLGLVLSAPVKLPGKALNILRYLALGLGIIESVIDQREGNEKRRQDDDSLQKPPEPGLQSLRPMEKGVSDDETE